MRPRAFALIVVAVALAVVGPFPPGAISPASAQHAPIGAWEVRHGSLGEIWAFAPDGKYSYQRYSAQFGSVTIQAEGGGTYIVQDSRLILRPSHGGVLTFQWRIGTHVTALPGEPVLFLRDEHGGAERLYYRK